MGFRPWCIEKRIDLTEDYKRLQYKNEHGVAPSDDMMPTGQIIAGAR